MIGRLRLISGLVLFVFVLGHFMNHALGIISVKAMNTGLAYTVEPWRTTTGTIIFLAALVVHAALAIRALYARKTFRMRGSELAQLVLGFLIPVVLAAHVLATRGVHEVFGLEEGYAFQLYVLWETNPLRGMINALALLVVWVHACIGWHHWLRLKSWYQSKQTYAFAFALLVPALALAGYVSAGVRIMARARNEKWVERLTAKYESNQPAVSEYISQTESLIQASTIGVVLLILAIYGIRKFILSKPGSEQLLFRSAELKENNKLGLRPGTTVLDLLRDKGIPHASVCGGRGRCSTCRVRIDAGLEALPSPSALESKVLSRIAAPPNVRLACQLVPSKSISATALLLPSATTRDVMTRTRTIDGEELEIAVLFADIRAFTQLSEAKLPFDTAFLLNRYFAAMGQAIEQSGGHVDKFIGDGVMAIFGIEKDLSEGCADAIHAARKMAEKLEALNTDLANDLPAPLKIGIGIHCGSAIVGTMGYKEASSLTAIGDMVNTSSRLEGITKTYDAQLVVSEETVKNSGIDFGDFLLHEVKIRGRNELLEVRVIENAASLPAN